MSEQKQKLIKHYEEALSKYKQEGHTSQSLVRLKMLVQLCGLEYEDHLRIAQSVGLDESLLTDSNGYSFQQWFSQKVEDAKSRCQRCGITVVSGDNKCPKCGEGVTVEKVVPLIEMSSETLERWNKLPQGLTTEDITMAILGIFITILAVFLLVLFK